MNLPTAKPWVLAGGACVFTALLGALVLVDQAEEPTECAKTLPVFRNPLFESPRKVVDVEEPVEETLFVHSADRAETADDLEFHKVRGGAPALVADKPFKGKGTYDVIDGGGGGGKYSGPTGMTSVFGSRRADASGPPPPVRKPAAVAQPTPQAAAEGQDVMIFKDHGINPFLDTAKETQSTFALDVDTASYTLMRSYLKHRMLPPKEAVRVEEFLNYLAYADPPPPQGAFAVRLEVAPSPFHAERHLLRVAIQAREMAKKDRKDVVLTFVIDVSGSMDTGNRLDLVKQSLTFLVKELRPSDRIGIVVYGSTGRKLLDPTPVARKDLILDSIDALRSEGNTNLEQGLDLGYDLAAAHLDPKATHRVIVCTDGVANNGLVDPDLLLKRVKERAEKGIWLSVLGFGMGNLNDALMEKLADSGNGNYAYIDEFSEAKKVFTEKLVGMLEVVAADAKVQVEFDARTVARFRLLGYENRHVANKDFRNDKIDAGELGAGHHVTALYDLELKPGAQGRLTTARLRYKEPGTNEVVETQESMSRGQVRADVKDASASYRLAAAVAAFAEILRQSPHAEGLTFARVLEQAGTAVTELDRREDAAEFLELVRAAAALKK